MVYLIGVYHEIQHTNDNTEPTDLQEVRKFTDYLENEAITHKVTLIAEECSEEIMRDNEAKTRPVRDIAAILSGVEHRYCDPDRLARKSLGILCRDQIKEKLGLKGYVRRQDEERIREEKRKYYPIREQRWFECIKDKLHQPMIFVCGDYHVKPFRALLTQHEYEATIISTGWGEKIKDNQLCRALD
jgi:hypothetical protein